MYDKHEIKVRVCPGRIDVVQLYLSARWLILTPYGHHSMYSVVRTQNSLDPAIEFYTIDNLASSHKV